MLRHLAETIRSVTFGRLLVNVMASASEITQARDNFPQTQKWCIQGKYAAQVNAVAKVIRAYKQLPM